MDWYTLIGIGMMLAVLIVVIWIAVRYSVMEAREGSWLEPSRCTRCGHTLKIHNWGGACAKWCDCKKFMRDEL